MWSFSEFVCLLIVCLRTESVYGSHAVIGDYSELNPNDCGRTRLTHGFDNKCFEWHNNPPTAPLIVGRNATQDEVPWIVNLFIFVNVTSNLTGYRPICTGSVIADQWVLTAAHCIVSGNPEDYLLVLGHHSLQSRDKLYATKALELYPHPNYIKDKDKDKYNDFIPRNDIALIAMNGTIKSMKTLNGTKYSTQLKSICLPEKNISHTVYEYAFNAGWGMVNLRQQPLQMGYKVLMPHPLILFPSLNLSDPQYKGFPLWTDLMWTLISDNQTLNCGGDSGGPLWQLNNGRAVIIGVAAMAYLKPNESCGNFEMGYSWFTRVSYHIDWIQNVTQLK